MAEEKRKSVRIKKEISVRYSEDRQKWDISTIRDISETGISFSTHKAFSPDTVITLLIKIPSMPLEWMELTGRVVNSDSNVTRIEFVNLQDKHKEAIQQYITWFLSKQGGEQR